MPIPTTIADLSTTAASNSPQGSESPTDGDNYIRALSAIIKQEHEAGTAALSAVVAQFASNGTASVGSGMVGFGQDLNYVTGKVGWHLKTDAINVTNFPWLADKTGATDSYAAIKAAEAFAYAAGKRLYFPAGVYVSTDYLLIRVKAFGEGRANAWDGVDGGTLLRPSGAGTGRLWTDIDGTDASTFKPFIVLGRNYAALEDMTIDDGASPWSAGVFIPGTRRNALRRVDILGTWDQAGLYLDATWSKYNSTLTALYPDVESDAGPLEFHADSCSLLGGKWGVRVEGTTRDPDSYGADPTVVGGFVWGYGGASDTVFMACRISSSGTLGNRQAGGGSVRISGAIKNAAKALQTIWFYGCALRTYSKYTADLAVCNRVGFIGGYAETTASDLGFDAALNVTTPTVSGYGVVSLRDFDHNGPFKLNDVQVAANQGVLTYVDTRRVVVHDINGRMKGPFFESNGSTETKIVSSQTNGDVGLYKDSGSGALTRQFLFTTASITAETDAAVDVGTSGKRFRDIRLSRQIVLGSTVTYTTSGASPEGVQTANVGSIHTNTAGGASTTLYVKTSGSGNTGWTAK